MEKILESLGLSHLIEVFSENKVGPSEVLSLTDADFVGLGVTAIGERAKLRHKSRELLNDAVCDSPIQQRVREFQSTRRRQDSWRRANAAMSSSTRNILAGWKHHSESKRVFKQIKANHGGGTFTVPAEVNWNFEQFQSEILKLFFPEGKSEAQNLYLSDLQFHIAHFNGKVVEKVINGEPFTIKQFWDKCNTRPIRIYLHTQKKKNQDQEASNQLATEASDDRADTGNIPSRPTAAAHAVDSDDLMPHALDSRPPTINILRLETLQGTIAQREDSDESLPSIYNPTPRRNRATGESRAPIPSTSAAVDSDDELPPLDSGTPTITFRRPETNIASTADQLADPPRQNNDDEELELATILSLLRSVCDTHDTYDDKNLISVSRDAVFEGAKRAFRRQSFNTLREISVQFAGEFGIDEGGPRREFMRLLVAEVARLPIFIGPEDGKLIEFVWTDYVNGTYRLAGQMLAYCLVHGGTSPSFLHPKLYHAITRGGGELDMDMTAADIYNTDIREQVSKLAETDPGQLSDEDYNFASMAGCAGLLHQPQRKDDVLKALVHFAVIGRVRQCIDQFCSGLETLGVLKAMRHHPNTMRQIFTSQPTDLTYNRMDGLFEVELSPAGSNARRQEDKAHAHWRDLLIDVVNEEDVDGTTMGSLLVFVTGADRVPPLGFQPPPRLIFHKSSANPEDQANFPLANTCANTLSLPLLEEYDAFKRNVVAATKIELFTTE